MALPSKLKGFNLFHNGENFVGKIAEVTLPKLTRKMEDWQGGGMSGPIKVDFGNEGIQMEWTAGGFLKSVLQQYRSDAPCRHRPARFFALVRSSHQRRQPFGCSPSHECDRAQSPPIQRRRYRSVAADLRR